MIYVGLVLHKRKILGKMHPMNVFVILILALTAPYVVAVHKPAEDDVLIVAHGTTHIFQMPENILLCSCQENSDPEGTQTIPASTQLDINNCQCGEDYRKLDLNLVRAIFERKDFKKSVSESWLRNIDWVLQLASYIETKTPHSGFDGETFQALMGISKILTIISSLDTPARNIAYYSLEAFESSLFGKTYLYPSLSVLRIALMFTQYTPIFAFRHEGKFSVTEFLFCLHHKHILWTLPAEWDKSVQSLHAHSGSLVGGAELLFKHEICSHTFEILMADMLMSAYARTPYLEKLIKAACSIIRNNTLPVVSDEPFRKQAPYITTMLLFFDYIHESTFGLTGLTDPDLDVLFARNSQSHEKCKEIFRRDILHRSISAIQIQGGANDALAEDQLAVLQKWFINPRDFHQNSWVYALLNKVADRAKELYARNKKEHCSIKLRQDRPTLPTCPIRLIPHPKIDFFFMYYIQDVRKNFKSIDILVPIPGSIKPESFPFLVVSYESLLDVWLTQNTFKTYLSDFHVKAISILSSNTK